MYLKSTYEIFDEFEKETTKEGRINCLRKNNSPVFQKVLAGAFHPHVKFFLDRAPKNYFPKPMQPGMTDYKMQNLMAKIYLFQLGTKNTPNLPYEKKEKLLVQFLEGMEPREAAVVLGMMYKALDVKYLTYNLVKEAFPNLLP